MAAKINWHRCGTKLHHCHPIYSRFLRVSCEDEMWYQCIISTARLFRAALIALCGLIFCRRKLFSVLFSDRIISVFGYVPRASTSPLMRVLIATYRRRLMPPALRDLHWLPRPVRTVAHTPRYARIARRCCVWLMGQTDGRTDGRTDTGPFYRHCSAYNVHSVKKQVQLSNRRCSASLNFLRRYMFFRYY